MTRPCLMRRPTPSVVPKKRRASDRLITITTCGKLDECGSHTAFIESGIDGEKIDEAPQQETRSHEQHQRERDFGDGEAGTDAGMSATGSARALFERVDWIAPRHLYRGH